MIDYTKSTHVIENATGDKKRARYERGSNEGWEVYVLEPFRDVVGHPQSNGDFSWFFPEGETSDYGLTLVPPADDEIPADALEDWACIRAHGIMYPKSTISDADAIAWVRRFPDVKRVALYIQSKEDPPENPLLQMARAVVGGQYEMSMPDLAQEYKSGGCDKGFSRPTSTLSIALAALKRAQKEWCGK